MPPPPGQTDRPPAQVNLGDVTLARWRSVDHEPLFAAVSANLEHLRPWMAFVADHGRDSIAQFLVDSETGWEDGERFGYAIRYRRAGIVGSAGLVSRIGPGGLEIGYWVDARHTRRGIATLATAALTELGLALSTVDHIEIHHNEANIASGAIPARLGFRKLGTFPAEPKTPAEVGREVHWRLDAAQFATSPARSVLDGGKTLIGGREKREIVIVDYDSSWPARYALEQDRVRGALGDSALSIEHIGSTAVPGLAAKPIVDMLVTVASPDDETVTVPALEAAGYELRVREPGHRMFRTPERDVHAHVWGHSDPQVARHLMFRDRLRRAPEDRDAYERLKRELATRDWADMNAYADAKGALIEAILARAGD